MSYPAHSNYFMKFLESNSLDSGNHNTTKFPPYNVSCDSVENPTTYTVEMAVAGFKPEDVNVKVRNDGTQAVLVITGSKKKEISDNEEFSPNYIYHGLSSRNFSREFLLAPSLTVKEVKLIDGILTITLDVKTIPDDVFEIKVK